MEAKFLGMILRSCQEGYEFGKLGTEKRQFLLVAYCLLCINFYYLFIGQILNNYMCALWNGKSKAT